MFSPLRIRLHASDFFGEMALLNGGPRSADVVALDFSKFLVLGRRDFRQFLKKHPALREHIVSLAAQREEMNRRQPEPGSDAGGDTRPEAASTA